MSNVKFLDKDGVSALWQKIDSSYVDNDSMTIILEAINEGLEDLNSIPIDKGTGEKSVVANSSGAQATGPSSFAEGIDTEATKEAAHAEGRWTSAVSKAAHSEGFDSVAGGTEVQKGSSPIGEYEAGSAAHAEGIGSFAKGTAAHSEGYLSNAIGMVSHAEGETTNAFGVGSHTEGKSTKAGGRTTTDIGGSYTHAEGVETVAYARGSHTEGNATTALGDYSHAEGSFTQTIGANAHAEGGYLRQIYLEGTNGKYKIYDNNKTNLPVWLNGYYYDAGEESAVDGQPMDNMKIYNGSYQHIGTIVKTYTVTGDDLYAVIDGITDILTIDSDQTFFISWSKAEGLSSHSEGGGLAMGNYSHAEGSLTWAAHQSHAEGHLSASMNTGSHAEGIRSRAHGHSSHAEGRNTFAKGEAAHTEGTGTISNADAQHVQGKYNVEDTENKYAHIVGGGSSNTDRENIHTLDWDGNAYYKGSVEATEFKGQATKAVKDGEGNNIAETYLKKNSSSDVISTLGFTPVDAATVGLPSGVASLDDKGMIPSSQLPSYVDDVIEGRLANNTTFYEKLEDGTEVLINPPLKGKIYVDTSSGKTYRWSGSLYSVISETLALGTTASTAFYGDKGQVAYNHATSQHLVGGSISNASITPKGNVSSSFSGTAESHNHTFTGTNANLSFSFVPSGSVNSTFTGGRFNTNQADSTVNVASANHSHSFTPQGTISQPTFSGLTKTTNAPTNIVTVAALNHTHTFTVSGTLNQPTFTGTKASTTSITGLTEVAGSDHLHTVTIQGTVSKPSFTGTAINSSVPNDYSSVYSITNVGTLPQLNMSVTSRCLNISFNQGSLPTRQSVNIPSSYHVHSVTAEGTVTQPTFSGTGSVNGPTTFANVASAGHTHEYTPAGTVSKSSFVNVSGYTDENTLGTTVADEAHLHDFLPEGTVSRPGFTGTTSTTLSVNGSTSVANDTHIHTIAVTGSVSSTFKGGTTSVNFGYTPSGTISDTSITPKGNVTSTFTGTAENHNHTFNKILE